MTDASQRTPNTRRVRHPEDSTPGNPGALLRTVPLPDGEVLVTPAMALYLQKVMDCPRRVVVDDPGCRWMRNGGRQRAGGDGLDLGDVEGRMYTEGGGKSETNGTGVNCKIFRSTYTL